MKDSITVITEPTVYLMGKQVIIQPELTRFLDDHDFSNWTTDSPSDPETLVEVAARTCYQSFKGGRGHADHIKHLLEVGHGSTCEHAVWNLLITGVSRSLTHELVRHRAGFAYSQLSQRYVDESVSEYVVPPDLADEVAAAEILFRDAWSSPKFNIEECECLLQVEDPLTEEEEAGVQWFAAMAMASLSYRRLSDYLAKKATKRGLAKTEARKFSRQAPRSVLPNATETKIFVTLNARAARHFCEQRGSQHAEPEIRKLANAMLDVLAKDSPNLFSDYERIPLPDGTYELKTPYPKV